VWSVPVVVLRRFMPVMVLGRRRYGVEARRLVRPDEQDTARRVIHNESRSAPETMGTEPCVVAIPRDNEHLGVLRCGDHLTFGTAATAFAGHIATKPGRGGRKKLCFR